MDAQKNAWEKKHDEPFRDNDLVEQARTAGAVPNFATGYYELNTLTDITEEQMRKILVYGNRQLGWGTFAVGNDTGRRIRTNIASGGTYSTQTDAQYLCTGQSRMEVFVLRKNEPDHGSFYTEFKTSYMAFYGCSSLRRIVGKLVIKGSVGKPQSVFEGCVSLEDMELTGINGNFYLGHLPRLSAASLSLAVTRRSGTDVITLTVHPDVYAKITDEAQTEWYALLDLADEHNVVLATTE